MVEPVEKDVLCPCCHGVADVDIGVGFLTCSLCDGEGYVPLSVAEQFDNDPYQIMFAHEQEDNHDHQRRADGDNLGS